MSSLLDAALEYADKGWPVLPLHFPTHDGKCDCLKSDCDSPAKHPRTSHGMKDATTDQTIIRQWWSKWPDANVGVVTGRISGHIVIDLDAPEAPAKVKALSPEYPWDQVPRVRTGRSGGGWQLRFKQPSVPIKSRSGVLHRVDIKAENGYGIAPPSVHISGKTYRWEVPVTGELPELPPELLELISSPSNNEANDGNGLHERFDTAQALAGVPEGQRDETLFRLACKLRNADVPQDWAEKLVSEAARNCQPPFPESTAQEKVARAYTQYPPKPVSFLPTPPLYTPVESEEVKTLLIWAKDVPPPKEGEEIESLWGPFFFPKSLHTMAGDAGLGKTTLAYNSAIHLARGEEFGGFKPPRPLRVLYYDLETPDLLFRTKLHLISENDPPEGLAFARSFSVSEALSLAKEHGFDLIIIDTLNEAFETRAEEDNAEANRQMRELRRIVKDSGAAIVALSHMGKDPSAKGVYKLRGASARPAAADVVLNLEPYSDDVVCLEVVKNRWVGGNVKLYLRKAGEDQFEIAEVAGENTATTEKQIREYIASIVPYEPATITTQEILSKAVESGYQRGTTEKVLSRMSQVGGGGVKRVKRGVYTRTKVGVEAPDPSFRLPGGIGKSDSEEAGKEEKRQWQTLVL